MAEQSPRWLSVPEHLKLLYCYEHSPICVPDGTPAPAPLPERFVPSTRPGTRAPHAWLADGRSTLDLFGDGFMLLRLGTDPADAAALIDAAKARGVPLHAIAIARCRSLPRSMKAKLVLVRPDGHVAWRGDACPAEPGLSSTACAAPRHKRRHDKPPPQRLVSRPGTAENDHERIQAAGSVKGCR